MAYDSEDSWLDEEEIEDPSPEDIERFSGHTRECPECGAEVYDDVISCPICGHFMGEGRHQLATWRIVMVVLLVLILSGLVFFLVR